MSSTIQIEIISVVGSKSIGTIQHLSPSSTIKDIKSGVHRIKKHIHPDRQSIRLETRGKSLKDEDTLQSLGIKNGGKLYLKDLGPQIGWSTVFLAEYAGPIGIYLMFYNRPWMFYGDLVSAAPMHFTVHLAAFCWTAHYSKRILETLFVHRFSHNTMPLFNLFKNCTYYWLFTAYVAYHVNHPLYLSPGVIQVFVSFGAFLLSEIGNYSIHALLRDLRPPGTKKRCIPVASGNPFTLLFNYVSCPNYTYEFGAWLSFTMMTQCLPAGMFALAGFYQMAVWAIGKHRNYKKEFSNYPKNRKAIIPFIM